MATLVTGASGNVGREVVRELLCAAPDAVLRIAARKPKDGATQPAPGNTTYVELDFAQPRTFAGALGPDTERLFLVRPPPIGNVGPTLNALVDEGVLRGRVKHIVFLSVVGADTNTIVPHHAVEQHLLRLPPELGVRVTLLRPGFFAQNLGDAYREDIARDDRLYVPAGRGPRSRVAFLDVRDMAEIAARRLLTPLHELPPVEALALTGPEAVSLDDVARILTDALGRPVRYIAASVLGYLWHLLVVRRLPLMQAIVLTILHVNLRFGNALAVDPTVERCLGRPATPLTAYVADTVRERPELWARPSQ